MRRRLRGVAPNPKRRKGLSTRNIRPTTIPEIWEAEHDVAIELDAAIK
jgi:hypothetical protein